MNGCSDSFENENPKVRLTYNGTGIADIQIKTSGGNTENINNIETSTSFPFRSFSPGLIVFTISIQDVKEPVIYELSTQYCTEYSVVI